MEKIKNHVTDDLIGSLVNYGGDPCLIETIEQAKELEESIARATSFDRITGEDEDFETICAQLDLRPEQTKEIWRMVDGSVFVWCFANDWEY